MYEIRVLIVFYRVDEVKSSKGNEVASKIYSSECSCAGAAQGKKMAPWNPSPEENQALPRITELCIP